MLASAAGTSIKVAVNEATATAEAARDVAAAATAEEVFKPNKFSTIPHISFFLLLLRLDSDSTRLSLRSYMSKV